MTETPIVLTIDDDDLVSMVLEDQLRDLGFDVVSTTTEALALEALEGRSFDLAVVDLLLKGFTPRALIRELQRAGVPILICTGAVGFAPIPDGLPFIAKPYSSKELRRAIGALVPVFNPD